MFVRSCAAAANVQVRMWSVFLGASLAHAARPDQSQQLFVVLLRDRAASVRAACVHVLADIRDEVKHPLRARVKSMCLTDPAAFAPVSPFNTLVFTSPNKRDNQRGAVRGGVHGGQARL